MRQQVGKSYPEFLLAVRWLRAMAALGGGITPSCPNASYEECIAYSQGSEDSVAAAHPIELQMMPAFDAVISTTQAITGVKGNDITRYTHMPKYQSEPGPCIVHMHGGGMVLMTAADLGFVRWRSRPAEAAMRIIGAEFRNGGGSLSIVPSLPD